MEENTKTTRIRFQLLVRLVARAAEVATRPEMTKEGMCVYSELVGSAGDEFCQRHEAVAAAESTVAEKRLHVRGIEAVFEGLYRTTQAIVHAFAPTKKLPDTLKTQRTDTDKLYAVATLVSVVKSYAGAKWADELMAGQFGTLAPKMVEALNELIAASDALELARNQRVAAYGPAYGGYLAFKRVVRNMLGSSSRAYRRLHPRAVASEETEPVELAEDAAPDSAVTPASKGTPALASGPSPVKVA